MVDDDPALLLLMGEALSRAGFTIAKAANGAEAISLFREFQPELVLLDIDMPEMDGFAACATMRREADDWDLPIVMVTSLDDAASIHRAFEVGATDFISKPINWPLFQYRVGGILAAAQTSERLVASNDKIQALQRLAPDMALVVARDGTIIDRLGSRSQRSRSSRAGAVADLWPKEIAKSITQHIHRVLKSRANTRFEFRVDTEGQPRSYEARLLAHGRHRVLLIVQEITPSKETEIYRLAYYDT